MITLDTSGIFALLDRRNVEHQAARAALFNEARPYIVPVPILAEIAFNDIPTVRRLVRRYGDLPLGFADASVIACAERNGGRILTLDRRDFDAVAREGRIVLVPG